MRRSTEMQGCESPMRDAMTSAPSRVSTEGLTSSARWPFSW